MGSDGFFSHHRRFQRVGGEPWSAIRSSFVDPLTITTHIRLPGPTAFCRSKCGGIPISPDQKLDKQLSYGNVWCPRGIPPPYRSGSDHPEQLERLSGGDAGGGKALEHLPVVGHHVVCVACFRRCDDEVILEIAAGVPQHPGKIASGKRWESHNRYLRHLPHAHPCCGSEGAARNIPSVCWGSSAHSARHKEEDILERGGSILALPARGQHIPSCCRRPRSA